MFGGFWFRTFLDRWAATAGRYEGAPARKRPCCSRVLLVDLLNLLSIDGERYPRRWFMNEISRSNVFSLLSAHQRLLERLEAENAQLRGRVAELMLEIQALRDALGHPQSDTQPNRCHRPSGHR